MKKVYLDITVILILFSIALSTAGITVNFCECVQGEVKVYSFGLAYNPNVESENCCKSENLSDTELCHTQGEKPQNTQNTIDENSCNDFSQNYSFDLKINVKSNFDLSYSFATNHKPTRELFTIIENPVSKIYKPIEQYVIIKNPVKRLLSYILMKSSKNKPQSVN